MWGIFVLFAKTPVELIPEAIYEGTVKAVASVTIFALFFAAIWVGWQVQAALKFPKQVKDIYKELTKLGVTVVGVIKDDAGKYKIQLEPFSKVPEELRDRIRSNHAELVKYLLWINQPCWPVDQEEEK